MASNLPQWYNNAVSKNSAYTSPPLNVTLAILEKNTASLNASQKSEVGKRILLAKHIEQLREAKRETEKPFQEAKKAVSKKLEDYLKENNQTCMRLRGEIGELKYLRWVTVKNLSSITNEVINKIPLSLKSIKDAYDEMVAEAQQKVEKLENEMRLEVSRKIREEKKVLQTTLEAANYSKKDIAAQKAAIDEKYSSSGDTKILASHALMEAREEASRVAKTPKLAEIVEVALNNEMRLQVTHQREKVDIAAAKEKSLKEPLIITPEAQDWCQEWVDVTHKIHNIISEIPELEQGILELERYLNISREGGLEERYKAVMDKMTVMMDEMLSSVDTTTQALNEDVVIALGGEQPAEKYRVKTITKVVHSQAPYRITTIRPLMKTTLYNFFKDENYTPNNAQTFLESPDRVNELKNLIIKNMMETREQNKEVTNSISVRKNTYKRKLGSD